MNSTEFVININCCFAAINKQAVYIQSVIYVYKDLREGAADFFYIAIICQNMIHGTH